MLSELRSLPAVITVTADTTRYSLVERPSDKTIWLLDTAADGGGVASPVGNGVAGGSSEPRRHLVLAGRLTINANYVTLRTLRHRAEAEVHAGLWLGVLPWDGRPITVTVRFLDQMRNLVTEDREFLAGVS